MVILMAWRGTVVAPVLMHWSCSSLALCHQCQYTSCSIHIASCSIHMLLYYHVHTEGLARHCGSSSADTLEMLQSCAVPSVSIRKLFYTYDAMLPWSYWWLGVESPTERTSSLTMSPKMSRYSSMRTSPLPEQSFFQQPGSCSGRNTFLKYGLTMDASKSRTSREQLSL